MVDVLFLCTGNLCRSPSAAWFLCDQLAKSGTQDVRVASAGTLGSTLDVPEPLRREGKAFGLDLSNHKPQRFDADMIRGADLIVGMAREHVREAILADPPSFVKTYTLRDIVRRGVERGPRGPQESLDQWLERLHAGRRHIDLIGDSPDDDIPDPMGGSSEDFALMLAEIGSKTRQLHGLIWR